MTLNTLVLTMTTMLVIISLLLKANISLTGEKSTGRVGCQRAYQKLSPDMSATLAIVWAAMPQ